MTVSRKNRKHVKNERFLVAVSVVFCVSATVCIKLLGQFCMNEITVEISRTAFYFADSP